jgi:hypothetical protein
MLWYTFSGIFIRVMWKLLQVNKQLGNIQYHALLTNIVNKLLLFISGIIPNMNVAGL